ncbi:hypothetical protein RJ639_032320 [Escallonia herrerae]|uniref:DUF4219 domain-containing protein n=1 Tax=Escallonia herrerae TaxID=1293975 RepID=A0AA88XA94_9ASTE|nr:hypothetical protein RJ639_032320 [Escallonia herrerae]
MTDLDAVDRTKKLNNINYNTWSTCMMSYMQGQDLWEVVNSSEVTQLEAEDVNGGLRKWKIKAGKAMFALKSTVEEDISELDPQALIRETRMKQIIIHGLRPEYRGFVATVQGWQTQPSLVKFENLLAGQEALAKQMGRASPKGQEEVVANKGR